MQDLILTKSSGAGSKVIIAVAAMALGVLCWYGIRWQLGNMVGSLTNPNDPGAFEAADMARDLAPGDPVASWLRASSITGISADPGSDPIREFQAVARLAPSDYRWRIELGRAYEQEEMAAEAEASFKKAVELAPTYAHPYWAIGNFYLREGRNEEAVAALKKAAENNQSYRDQVFSLAWDFFGKDPAKVESMVGDQPDARVRLAYFFASRSRPVDSLRIWNELGETDKAANPDTAKAIAHGLFLQKFFPESLEFARQLGIDGDSRPETITNGSMEKGLSDDKDSRFNWQLLRNDPKFEVVSDSKVKKEGDRSLKVTFRTYLKPALNNLIQTVVVKPNGRYRLSFWIRTENLKSGGPPLIEVVNAVDDKLIVRSQPFPTGSNEWQQVSVDFSVPENCSAVIVRTARAYCGEECPITGVFWYDDFTLTRL